MGWPGGLLETDCWAPPPRGSDAGGVGRAWEFTFLTCSQEMLLSRDDTLKATEAKHQNNNSLSPLLPWLIGEGKGNSVYCLSTIIQTISFDLLQHPPSNYLLVHFTDEDIETQQRWNAQSFTMRKRWIWVKYKFIQLQNLYSICDTLLPTHSVWPQYLH